ncbi:MAG: GDP-mannose 4,6-dehydratase [Microgenomates group bacterium GW2011_GWC1_38_12]|uniref:GDP-mannose 4,6-dehydratase n=1 Tax=Candidatus Vogelbacteria bacterium RIFOXYB1_FULL_42_16 TaxID=1802436 RepID=A0A1G2QEY6_9BACT|nr:MAG: GDP-mannose 4,6-dehydratase [Microgenomates group bacterium GW2011_GWC1_38_12]KKS78137.1 MAG: GDP-mannose 4,6-dehydratase [Parcubacteria group bacterium GW2011_GWB1_42_9]OHA59136.1 MAG: hypothetical protein A2370_03045 [Candidatus Vogelbacteria bacterium RIFOXYB1_FULL_42_16]
MKKIALITGITGQDGSYMAELLLEKGYEVHGIVRRNSVQDYRNIRKIKDKIKLHEGDLADSGSLHRIMAEVMPDEVYNFGAMAGVSPSFKQPEFSLMSCGVSVCSLLEAVRLLKPSVKFFQASSSHMFGNTCISPQNELTPLQPISPYGCGKALGHNLVRHYRESYKMFVVSGIMYAHASPRYSEGFLLSKIVSTIRRIKAGEDIKLEVGDIDVPMDIGYAKDYVEAIYQAVQLDTPEDFIIGTGEIHTPREFIELSFKEAGLDLDKYLVYNESLKRPSEVSALVADYSKANKFFDYKPKTSFNDFIKIMVNGL